MIFTYSVTKVLMGNDLGSHAKPLLYMSKASHDEPHGLWTVIDKREYEFYTLRRSGGWVEGVFIESHLEEYNFSCSCMSHMALFFL